MSALYKRKGSPNFYVSATRESTGTNIRKHAEEFAKKAQERLWREEKLGDIRKSWADLVADWESAKGHKATLDKDKMIARQFGDLLKRRKVELLTDVTSEHVSQYLKETKARTGANTANRHLNTLRAMFRRAVDHAWLDRAPRFERYEVVASEVTVVSSEQFNAIIVSLSPLDATIARLALLTGMRQANVCGLRWDWINGAVVTVPAIQTKARRTYTAVLPKDALDILELIRPTSSHPWVFDYKGAPRIAEAVSHAWNKAALAADLAGTRFHDLRHTWASNHTRNGTSDRILQAIGGWQSPVMLKTYSHFATEQLTEVAENGVAK